MLIMCAGATTMKPELSQTAMQNYQLTIVVEKLPKSSSVHLYERLMNIIIEHKQSASHITLFLRRITHYINYQLITQSTLHNYTNSSSS
jgi:hypothetical protein